jgi:DNA-binding CsgD family transcriptional regulator
VGGELASEHRFSEDELRLRRIVSLILVVVGVGGVIDLILDRPETFWNAHVVFEIGLLIFSLSAALYLSLGWRRAGDSLQKTKDELSDRAAERDAWRTRAEKLLKGLGEAIDVQFNAWDLTPAERETALFVLKGFGYKEIAAFQSKSERTVRQHALSAYKKSGHAGRAEFAAFFLEDLLLPLDSESGKP